MDIDKRYQCCCFTGHRPEKLNAPEASVISELQVEIHRAIEDGYTTFITGMARGVDVWAGELVLLEKKENPSVTLVAAVPFEGFEKNWPGDWKARYAYILSNADEVEYICRGYSRSSFQLRNKWMVDHSSRVIAVYNGGAGGTKNTVAYAHRCGVDIRNIL